MKAERNFSVAMVINSTRGDNVSEESVLSSEIEAMSWKWTRVRETVTGFCVSNWIAFAS